MDEYARMRAFFAPFLSGAHPGRGRGGGLLGIFGGVVWFGSANSDSISDQTMTSFSGTFTAVNISHVSSRIVLNVIITEEVVSAGTLHGASILC